MARPILRPAKEPPLPKIQHPAGHPRVAAHGGQYGLHDKYDAGQDYDPNTFVDPEGFLAEVERLERLYLEQLAEEQRQ